MIISRISNPGASQISSKQKRLVLALQFWEGDREAALRNARRIADNELGFRNDTEFCLAARFDAKHDPKTVEHLRKKFHVSTYTGRNKGTGWPRGCNDLWTDLMAESARRVRSGVWENVKAVMTFESDCIPIDPDWLDAIHYEWDLATAAGDRLVLGAWQPQCTPIGHINGNALFHPSIADRLSIGVANPVLGWDCEFANQFAPYWVKSGLIKNMYQAKKLTDEKILEPWVRGCRPVVVHGVKDLSVEEYADRVLRKT